jgi:hypothetical protein
MTNYLPRINTVLNDQGLKVAPPPAGPKVTLLGVTSNSAIPLFEPFTVGSVEKAINSLYFNYSGVAGYPTENVPGELSIALEEAISAGAPNIEVMVIGHKSGQTLIDYAYPGAALSGRYVDLASAYDVLKNRECDVVVPVGVYMDDSIYTSVSGATPISSWNFGKQLANFCYQATAQENACAGVISTRPVLSWAMRNSRKTNYFAAATGVGGSSLANGDATIYSELESLFGAAWLSGDAPSVSEVRSAMASVQFGTPSTRLVNEWYNYHIYNKTAMYTTMSGLYDSTYDAWIHGAADSDNNLLSDVNPNTASAVSSNYFASWQAVDSDGAVVVDSRNVKVDAGAYLSVFTCPVRSVGTQLGRAAITFGASLANTSMNSSGAAGYAGLITSLAPQSSTTNKQVAGLLPLKLLSSSQANNLTGIRHVTLYTRSTGFTVASGLTGAHNVSRYVRSDYTRLSTLRITQSAVDLIRAIASKYIGEPNNAPQMNALDAEIDQILLSMKGQGALNSYSFSITSTPDQRVLGELDINLTLVPAFEITTINLTVSLSKEL